MADYTITNGKAGVPRQYVRGGLRIDIPESASVEEHPIVSGDYSVTPYFGLVLDSAPSVPPESEATIYVNLPVDTGIYLFGKGVHTLIDEVPRWPLKYSLYGTPSDGITFRYFRAPYHSKPPKREKHKVLARVRIFNREDEWIVVSKFLFPQKYYNMFKTEDGEVVGEAVDIYVESANLATVTLKNKSSQGRSSSVLLHGPQPTAKAMAHIKQNLVSIFEMRHGL
ncbi:Uncharacterised protein [uncultured archaeon]|nr:Uncharacterised protein [uncultured archaeon]